MKEGARGGDPDRAVRRRVLRQRGSGAGSRSSFLAKSARACELRRGQGVPSHRWWSLHYYAHYVASTVLWIGRAALDEPTCAKATRTSLRTSRQTASRAGGRSCCSRGGPAPARDELARAGRRKREWCRATQEASELRTHGASSSRSGSACALPACCVRGSTEERRTMTATCVVKEQRMDKAMLDELVFHATDALAVEMSYTDIASYIKKHMTASFTGVWHVVVGRNFCGSFTHQENNAAYLYFGQTGILCYRTV